MSPWLVQMCHWSGMEHNERNQWPLLLFSSLSAFLPALLSLRALHLLLQMYKFVSDHCKPASWHRLHTDRADATVPGGISLWWTSRLCGFFPQSLYSRRIKSDWCQIKFHPWDTESDACQIESGHGVCFFTYTSGGFTEYIFIWRGRGRAERACGGLGVVSSVAL